VGPATGGACVVHAIFRTIVSSLVWVFRAPRPEGPEWGTVGVYFGCSVATSFSSVGDGCDAQLQVWCVVDAIGSVALSWGPVGLMEGGPAEDLIVSAADSSDTVSCDLRHAVVCLVTAHVHAGHAGTLSRTCTRDRVSSTPPSTVLPAEGRGRGDDSAALPSYSGGHASGLF
jgi:hypothetical protein